MWPCIAFVSALGFGAQHPAVPQHDATHTHEMHPDMQMAMPPEVLGLAPTRNASGTSWQPDHAPMFALHGKSGNWSGMLHANVVFGYDHQASDRGDSEWLSVNWLMLMARHPLWGGEFMPRVMLSLEPVTMADDGYPLLLQSGETFDGQPLHDRQHPHDLFMEVAAQYTRALHPSVAAQVYGALSGEPALGPPAFPHRASAASDPLAPLGHHWQDATHISFGVLTAGLFTRAVKVEGSWFNGREPDEDRADFDLREFDSYSGRLSWNPSAALSLQASYGFLESPEALEPDVSVHRATASVQYVVPVFAAGSWASTLVWGRNAPAGHAETDMALLETDLDFDGRNTVFGRVELGRKSGLDLVVPGREDDLFDLGSFVLGYVRDARPVLGWRMGLGVRGSVNVVDEDLEPSYGTRTPAGVMVFVRARPAVSHQAHMPGHSMSH